MTDSEKLAIAIKTIQHTDAVLFSMWKDAEFLNWQDVGRKCLDACKETSLALDLFNVNNHRVHDDVEKAVYSVSQGFEPVNGGGCRAVYTLRCNDAVITENTFNAEVIRYETKNIYRPVEINGKSMTFYRKKDAEAFCQLLNFGEKNREVS